MVSLHEVDDDSYTPICVGSIISTYFVITAGDVSQGSKFKTNQYHKRRLQIFDVWCKNVRQISPFLQSQAK